jgi:urease accessory protein
MYDATLPYEQDAALQRGSGVAEIAFARRGARSALAHLYQRTPCRVLFPAADGDTPLAVLLTTSGGLTGGDRIALRVAVETGASACLTTQAAEKLYRSLGPDTSVGVDLSVGAGASLDYLPQETILFDGARLVRRTAIDVAPGGRFCGAEMLAFGRAARGEILRSGRLFESWRIARAGKLVWYDALALEGAITQELGAPFSFAGAEAVATSLYVGEDAERLLPCARDLAEGAASLVNGVLVARLLGSPAARVRAELVKYLMGLRQEAGLDPLLPRLWNI